MVDPFGKRGRERRDSCSNADRDRQDVVNQQRRRGDETGELAKILASDDIRAAAAGIRVHGLAVREHDDGKNGRDDGGDWTRKRERAHVDEDEHPQNLFGCVRDGRKRIGGQDGESGDA
jgi:hypothetical protein